MPNIKGNTFKKINDKYLSYIEALGSRCARLATRIGEEAEPALSFPE
jgi:hypothetical protein